MYHHVYIYIYIGVRDLPLRICCPWVRGGWGLDNLGEFFRRRRRRRPPGVVGGGGAENSALPEIKLQKCAAGRIFVILFLKFGGVQAWGGDENSAFPPKSNHKNAPPGAFL